MNNFKFLLFSIFISIQFSQINVTILSNGNNHEYDGELITQKVFDGLSDYNNEFNDENSDLNIIIV